MKNSTDGGLERLSWTHSNTSKNISQLTNQDAGKTKIEDKEDKDENENKREPEIRIENKIKVGNEEGINVEHGRATTGKTKVDSNETALVLNKSNLTPDAFPEQFVNVYWTDQRGADRNRLFLELHDFSDEAEGSQQSGPVAEAHRTIVRLANTGHHDQYEEH